MSIDSIFINHSATRPYPASLNSLLDFRRQHLLQITEEEEYLFLLDPIRFSLHFGQVNSIILLITLLNLLYFLN